MSEYHSLSTALLNTHAVRIITREPSYLPNSLCQGVGSF
jgi:hypothetical protein